MATFRTVVCFLAVGAFLGGGTLGAQETLMNDGIRHGGFGAPVVKLTQIDDRFGVLMGGRGGWIINGSVVIGGGGYGLANSSSFDLTNGAGDSGTLEMGYGGLELGYVHRPDALVHVSVGLLIGGGGVAWNRDGPSGSQVDDSFFVVEPEADVVLNVTRILRIGAGVSYRFARGVELFELRDADLSGFAGVVAFNFGSF